MKKPSARRQKLREKALAEYLTMPPEERAKRNREFVRKMRVETQAWDDFQKIHLDGVMAHYAHAREKHPYFCDRMLPAWAEPNIKDHIRRVLENRRARLKQGAGDGNLLWNEILDCEVWEATEAIYERDYAHAVEELYDCVAVCLRAIDVLEGRQALGNPKTISGNSAGETTKEKNK